MWTNARWTGPARGYVDPLKEVQAQIAAIDAGLMSRSDAIAERGGVFDEVTQRLAEEKTMREEAGLGAPAVQQPEEDPKNGQDSGEEESEEDER